LIRLSRQLKTPMSLSRSKVNQAADGTQRNVDKAAQNTLNKTGNAINNAMDIE